MLDFLKKKRNDGPKSGGEIISAPLHGLAVDSLEVNDPTFREEMLGKAMAIRPGEGKVYAPVDGEVVVLMESKHAVSITSRRGADILIHIGLDTVKLGGRHFTACVREGDWVKRGDLLLEFDLEAIAAAGYDLISPVIICNTEDYREILRFTGREVRAGDPVMELRK